MSGLREAVEMAGLTVFCAGYVFLVWKIVEVTQEWEKQKERAFLEDIQRIGVIRRNSRGQVFLDDYSKICAVFFYHTAIKVGHLDERLETDLGFLTWFHLRRAARKYLNLMKGAIGLNNEDIENC